MSFYIFCPIFNHYRVYTFISTYNTFNYFWGHRYINKLESSRDGSSYFEMESVTKYMYAFFFVICNIIPQLKKSVIQSKFPLKYLEHIIENKIGF